jgi:hypothetical protein
LRIPFRLGLPDTGSASPAEEARLRVSSLPKKGVTNWRGEPRLFCCRSALTWSA